MNLSCGHIAQPGEQYVTIGYMIESVDPYAELPGTTDVAYASNIVTMCQGCTVTEDMVAQTLKAAGLPVP